MIGSKAVGLLKNITPSSRKLVVQQLRKSSDHAWHYRTVPEPPTWSKRGAEIVCAMGFHWFAWNMYHGWKHVVGIYDGDFLRDPRTYTDEELGIPPDDA